MCKALPDKQTLIGKWFDIFSELSGKKVAYSMATAINNQVISLNNWYQGLIFQISRWEKIWLRISNVELIKHRDYQRFFDKVPTEA